MDSVTAITSDILSKATAFGERLALPLLLLALAVLLPIVHTIVSTFYRYFLRPGVNLRKYGEWAIVTGCTDGIGLAFCDQLARKKINLVMIARSAPRLEEVSAALTKRFPGLQTRTVVADLSDTSDATWDKIASALAGLDLGLLINNAGVSYEHAEFFHELDDATIRRLVDVNIHAVTRLTKLVLPLMLAKKGKGGKKGAIINIGSGSATCLPSDPLYAVYAGTKAYVDQMTRCLYSEYRARGIDFQLQAPLSVATKMSKIRRPTLTAPSALTYASWGLRAIGHGPRTTPYWVHDLMWGLMRRLPESLWDRIRLNMTTDLRRRALKRKAAAAGGAGEKKGQ